MTAFDQLRARADRILSDGLKHSDATIAWAFKLLNEPQPVPRMPLSPQEAARLELSPQEGAYQ